MPEAQETSLAPQGESFADRKATQLSQERDLRGEVESVIPEDPESGAAEGETELAAEDVEQDTQDLYANEEASQDDLEDSSDDPDGAASDEDQTPEGDSVDWEKSYKELQSMTQADVESRGEREREYADSMSQNLQLRFEMEDRLSEAVQRAEYMKNVMSGNAQQFRNINWSQVPQDKYQEVQAQAQQAMQMEQQAEQAWNQMKTYTDEQRDVQRGREAAVAKLRLKGTIPNWSNETYGQLREFAVNAGMPVEEFNNITNPVIIEALHAYQTLKNGASTVQQVVNNRKTAAPRNKAQRRQPRDARGKFARSQLAPNQRGSFADKHKHRLAMERQGR